MTTQKSKLQYYDREKLKEFVNTKRQEEYIDTVFDNDFNIVKAAAQLGIQYKTLKKELKNLRELAATKGYAPQTYPNLPEKGFVTPEGYTAPFATVQYNAQGEVERIWPRFKKEIEDYNRQVLEAIDMRLEGANILPLEDTLSGESLNDQIIPFIQIGDGHIGMLAHAREVGQNFDIKIGSREIIQGIYMLIDQMPKHERCVINDLGDFTHYENYKATTEHSGHALDYDTRFPKMIDAALHIMEMIIDKALSKYQIVDFVCNQGNHSRTNDWWMARYINKLYQLKAPGRVNVLNNDNVFIPYRMGRTFVLFHHSDKCKPSQLIKVMSEDYAKHWGETEYRYIDIGHIHHNMQLKEHPGVVVESFNTLANKDKYAHDYGYRSKQSVTAVFRSKEYGEVGRIKMPIRKIRDRLFQDFEIPLPQDIPVHTV